MQQKCQRLNLRYNQLCRLQDAPPLNNQSLRLVSEISQEILSTFDQNRILNLAVSQIVDKIGLLGGILFLVEGKTLRARTIAGSSMAGKFIKLIESPVNKLEINLEGNTDNLVVDTVKNKRDNFNFELYKFTKGVLSRPVTSVARAITQTKACLSLPLVVEDEAIGAMFFSKARKEDFAKELPVLRILTSHVAIAITNAINNDRFHSIQREAAILHLVRNKLAGVGMSDLVVSPLGVAVSDAGRGRESIMIF